MMVRLKPWTLNRDERFKGIGISCALMYLIAYKHAQCSSHAATASTTRVALTMLSSWLYSRMKTLTRLEH